MIEGFDELFDKFFNNKKNSGIGNEINDLIKILNNYRDVTGADMNDEKKLGKPTKIEIYTENGVTYEKKIWEVENGKIVKVEIKNINSSDPIEVIPKMNPSRFSESSLEDRLAYAISKEDYEEAARLRDLINERENEIVNKPKKRGRPKKNN